ncbi:MAG: hypothetical protein WBB37_12280 [bacterium]
MLLMFIILMDIDSSGVDSLKTYEIPAIINFGFDSTLMQKMFHITQEIVPDYFDLDIPDVLYRTPWIVNESGMAQPFILFCRGQTTGFCRIFLNNHELRNHLSGSFDLNLLSVQFAEKLTLSGDQMHAPGLNILTKINRYDRPFSFVQYTTGSFGSNLYTADLSRPLTNDLGFYLSGMHWACDGHRSNTDHKTNSFYTNVYWQKMIPGRLDIIYLSETAGFPGSDQDTLNGIVRKDFIDASICTGNKNHKLTFYYTINSEEYTNLNTLPPFHNTVKNIGIDVANYHDFQGIECEYRFAGALSLVDSDAYGSHNLNSLGLWTRLTKRFNNFILSGSSLFDLKNTEDFYIMPKFTTGIEIFDSVFIYGSLSRHYRPPLIAEIHTPDSLFATYYPLVGNADLRTEYYWSQELSIKRKNAGITLYKHDYDDRIIFHADNNGQYIAQNAESWQTIGIESSLAARIYLTRDLDKETATTIAVGYYGNFIFQGDTLPLLPKGNSSADITFERQTRKFTLGASFRERFTGDRQDLSGNDINAARVFSAVGYIRLLDLYISLRCDNVFDEEYFHIPDYTMPLRNYSLAVKWNFWD